MSRWSLQFGLILLCTFLAVQRAPAPLIYRAGEGWTYESPGQTGKWQKTRARDQLEIAEQALAKKDTSLALKC